MSEGRWQSKVVRNRSNQFFFSRLNLRNCPVSAGFEYKGGPHSDIKNGVERCKADHRVFRGSETGGDVKVTHYDRVDDAVPC